MGWCRLEAVSRDGSMRVPISALSWLTHGVTTRLTHWYQQTGYTLRCGSLHGAGQGWQALSHKGLPHPSDPHRPANAVTDVHQTWSKMKIVCCILQVRSRRVTGAEHDISTLEAALQAGPSSAMLLAVNTVSIHLFGGKCPAQCCQCNPGPCFSPSLCQAEPLTTELPH